MHIWVDADACPKDIKAILFRAAVRHQIDMTLIANHPITIARSQYISFYQVPQGFDKADEEILLRLRPNDLVISADIPLAASVIERGATVLSPRGEHFNESNIASRLTLRNFMETLRASGISNDGPAPLSQGDRKNFADNLAKILR